MSFRRKIDYNTRALDSGAQRLHEVQERIEQAARRAGQNPQNITLVAVTKTVPFERVLPLLQAGVQHVGENRVQEALAKYQEADGSARTDAQLHLIGPLQSNKAKKAASFFHMIQSLDRLSIADDLNRHAADLGKTLDCLVEVKVSGEMSKSGIQPEALDEFLGQLKARKNLRIRGLMGIPPVDATGEKSRPFFARLKQLFDKAKLDILSMGMSSDFEEAILEGSTMVRLGTILFGARPAL